MTIHIFKKPYRLFILGKLSILCFVLTAFQFSALTPNPQIKTKIHKVFLIDANKTTLEKHTETKYNIHGEIIEYAEYIENKQGTSSLKQLKIIKYNVQGLYLGTMVYDHNNALVWSEENTYDETDQIKKITHTTYGEIPIITYTTLSYDEQGNIILSKTYNKNGNQLSEQKRTYAATGELTSAFDWIYIDRNSKSIKKTVSLDNQYNTKGQIIQSTVLSQEGKDRTKDVKLFKNNAIINWSKYKNGRLISQFTNTKKDTILPIKDYELPPPIPEQNVVLEYDDAKRNPLANIPHRPFKTVTLKNNKQGTPIKKITRIHNQITEVIYYTYNNLEQLISEKIHDKLTRNTQEIQYEYDHHSNPIKKTFLKNESLTQKHLYSYEYYRQR